MSSKIALFSLVMLMLPAVVAASASLSIHSAEQRGFERGDRSLYQLVGAVDGWRGKWAGERVELYQFAQVRSLDVAAFEALLLPGNGGWTKLCTGRNLIMLSTGERACRRLQGLVERR